MKKEIKIGKRKLELFAEKLLTKNQQYSVKGGDDFIVIGDLIA